ncbi:MAG: regulatory protein RecX [Deinococcales bacterium]|nr:regulatory protein RecX [Deinococcales bacterium]
MAGRRYGRRRGAAGEGAEGAREARPRKPFTAERAWEYLLFILARRSYTVAELRQRLERRGLPAEEGEPLLERLVELRLVDDALYAEQYVHARQAARGRSALRRELRRKGVDEELVEQELADLTPEQQTEAATELLERNAWRYRPTAEAEAESASDEEAYQRRERLYKARAKAFAFLARRGFGADAAAAAVERVGWFDDDA